MDASFMANNRPRNNNYSVHGATPSLFHCAIFEAIGQPPNSSSDSRFGTPPNSHLYRHTTTGTYMLSAPLLVLPMYPTVYSALLISSLLQYLSVINFVLQHSFFRYVVFLITPKSS
ncbi:hypothetical protein BKA82DRAFT_4226478 [Pisolithus tinctorius]|nr:hypothetical protein BKA82DRAFT_4226478 [Pisolithus tinctorius]